MFRDAGQTLEDFAYTMYVRCPQCARCAYVIRIISPEDALPAPGTPGEKYARIFHSRKLSCLHCGHTKIWNCYAYGIVQSRVTRDYHGVVQSRWPYDWYFHRPLWLQTPCCGEILWAFNAEHLTFLEQYVTAKQRARPYVQTGARNRTIASRLPFWFKSAKNRDTVLKGITQLKALLAQR